jgi:hypothetical protein
MVMITLMMEAVLTSETSAYSNETTRYPRRLSSSYSPPSETEISLFESLCVEESVFEIAVCDFTA